MLIWGSWAICVDIHTEKHLSTMAMFCSMCLPEQSIKGSYPKTEVKSSRKILDLGKFSDIVLSQGRYNTVWDHKDDPDNKIRGVSV